MGQRRLEAHMGWGVQGRGDDEWVGVRFPKLWREQEQPRLEPNNFARGDGAMHEHFPGRLGPVGEEIPDDRFVEEPPGGERRKTSSVTVCIMLLDYIIRNLNARAWKSPFAALPQPVGDEHERVFLLVESPGVSRDQFEAVLFRHRGLKGVRQFPTVRPSQLRSARRIVFC